VAVTVAAERAVATVAAATRRGRARQTRESREGEGALSAGWNISRVNILLQSGWKAAQGRVTGGRWRRIVLGDVLAKHVFELRGPESGLTGSGSFQFWQRPHRWVCHRGRSNITLAGSHCRDPPAIVSQAGLQARAGSPETRYEVRVLCARTSVFHFPGFFRDFDCFDSENQWDGKVVFVGF
jgi:hypothetical protein